MKLYNSLTRSISEINKKEVLIYTCGPTVYNHVHIGNLSSFIYADTLKRVLQANGITVRHIMNFTDVDDKTIKASKDIDEGDEHKALKTITARYEASFLEDLELLGFDIDSYGLIRATQSIEEMQTVIRAVLAQGNAYIADDGIYFDIQAYRKEHIYGQLVEITEASTGAARVNNDEYDKDNIHDFALWKFKKADEPSWDFEIDGKNYAGRPGWHIECTAMSKKCLGLPFDIHTGGVDLKFPHHENEIAQALGSGEDSFCDIFMHNEHLLVDGAKMSKSKNNFYTLKDIIAKGYSPMVFRLLVLKGHYRKNTNFSFEELDSVRNLYAKFIKIASLRHQEGKLEFDFSDFNGKLLEAVSDDLNTPKFLSVMSELDVLLDGGAADKIGLDETIKTIDLITGLDLAEGTPDISDGDYDLIESRNVSRRQNDYGRADEIRQQLNQKGIELNDLSDRTLWFKQI